MHIPRWPAAPALSTLRNEPTALNRLFLFRSERVMRATFQRPEIKSVGVRVGEITGLAFRVKSVADQCSLKMPSTGLISAGLMRLGTPTVASIHDPFARLPPEFP